MAQDAFDLAEQFQTPVFVMSDLDLGMNNWMAIRSSIRTSRSSGARCLSKEDLERLGGFARYKDVDGDGSVIARCPAPTIPRQLISRAAAGTTKRRSTASVPTITKTTWSGSNRKFETARSLFRGPS